VKRRYVWGVRLFLIAVFCGSLMSLINVLDYNHIWWTITCVTVPALIAMQFRLFNYSVQNRERIDRLYAENQKLREENYALKGALLQFTTIVWRVDGHIPELEKGTDEH
jgi:hypothetical protein